MIQIILYILIIILLVLIYHILKAKQKNVQSYSEISPEDLFNQYLRSIPPPPQNQTIQWQDPSNPHKLALAIIEPRNHPNLPYVLYNVAHLYSTVPPQDKPSLYIFHGTDNETTVKEITKNFQNINLISLNQSNLTIPEYNELLTSSSFYTAFENASHVLIFQTDVMQFQTVPNKFFEYDYVGAPWEHRPAPTIIVGNGGFSLRKISKMKEICNSKRLEDSSYPEDVFFATYPNLHVPTPEIASEFSVEQIFHPNPIGTHQLYRTLSIDQVATILESNFPKIITTPSH